MNPDYVTFYEENKDPNRRAIFCPALTPGGVLPKGLDYLYMLDANFWRDCLDVEADPGKMHGEPTVGPYRVEARIVVECEELGDTPDQIADDYGLPLASVRAVLNYFHARQAQLAPTL